MDALEYAQNLIRFDSTSHLSNAEISEYVESVFHGLGCETERVEYNDGGVAKVCVVARKGGSGGGLAWFGHTDVVPADDWAVAEHGPFEPVVRDDRLYGRGSTDMKGPMACMLAALHSLGDEEFQRPFYMSCTPDEEIDHRGAKEVVKRSKFYRELIDNRAKAIVGEPTQLGVVYAHKGGCQIAVTAHGVAAHSSTREGVNANMKMIPFLAELKILCDETETDARWRDDEFEPPTPRINIGVNDHNAAINITSPRSVCTMLIRPMPKTNVDELIYRVGKLAESHGVEFELRANHRPFRRDPCSRFVGECAELSSGAAPRTVSYGTEACQLGEVEDLVVLGPGDIAQAHKSDEFISLDQLEQGQQIYRRLLENFCLRPN